MSTIRTDETGYTLDNLSEEAQAQLQRVQFVDRELAQTLSKAWNEKGPKQFNRFGPPMFLHRIRAARSP